MEPISSPAMLMEILVALREDITASECMVALISGAALNFRYDSSLRPFPSMFMNDGEKDIAAVRMAFSRIPRLSTISENSVLDPDALALLHWCLCCQPFKLHSGEKFPGADYLFDVEPSPQQRRQFEDAKQGPDSPVSTAFHGTKLESVFSIMNCGLLAHMNKVGVFGKGIYLTTERHVAQNFTNSVAIWDKSSLGTHLRCIAVCEYVVDHPDVLSTEYRGKKRNIVPEKYILVKNNLAVRIKSLIFYSTRAPKSILTSRNIARWWSHVRTNKFFLIALIYVSVLLSLKLYRSEPVQKIWSMLYTKRIRHK